MASRVRIKWKPGVFRELRTLPAVMDELNRHADQIAARAGDGYEARPAGVTGGRGRGRASVGTGTVEAMHDNATNHTLLRALGGGS